MQFAAPFEFISPSQSDLVGRVKILAARRTKFDDSNFDIRLKDFVFKLFAETVSETDTAKRERNFQSLLILMESGAFKSTTLSEKYFSSFSIEYKPWYPDGEDFRFCKFEPIHFLAHACIVQRLDENPAENRYFKTLVDSVTQEGQTLEAAKKDLQRWRAWQESGLVELIKIENRKRKKGRSAERWLHEGVEADIAKIKAASNWNSPMERIQYYPTSLRNGYREGVNTDWQKGVWSDIVASNIIERDTIQRWIDTRIFSDSKVEAFKGAMFAGNISEMKRLIDEEKVDVNAIGKDNLTLAYLALAIDDDPRPIELLLRHGANPNIINNAKHKQQGLAAVHVIAKTEYCRLFRTIFEHGGDPNLLAKGRSPIGFVPVGSPDWRARLEVLCRKGGDMGKAYLDSSIAEVMIKRNYYHAKQNPPNTSAASFPDLNGPAPPIFTLLKLGAAYNFTVEDELSVPKYPAPGVQQSKGKCWLRTPHLLLETYPTIGEFNPLFVWLENQGVSVKEARTDLARWKKWIEEGKPELIQQEFEARKSIP